MSDGHIAGREFGGPDLNGSQWWDETVLRLQTLRLRRRSYPPIQNPPEAIDVCTECGAYMLPELGCTDPRHAAVGAIARRSTRS